MNRMPVLHLSDTAANDSDKTITVKTGSSYLVNSIRVEYTATATVGNRTLAILITDASDDVVLGFAVANNTITASQAMVFNFYESAATSAPADGAAEGTQALPYRLRLPSGYKIRIYDSAAIAAAADDMVIHLLVEEEA